MYSICVIYIYIYIHIYIYGLFVSSIHLHVLSPRYPCVPTPIPCRFSCSAGDPVSPAGLGVGGNREPRARPSTLVTDEIGTPDPD